MVHKIWTFYNLNHVYNLHLSSGWHIAWYIKGTKKNLLKEKWMNEGTNEPKYHLSLIPNMMFHHSSNKEIASIMALIFLCINGMVLTPPSVWDTSCYQY